MCTYRTPWYKLKAGQCIMPDQRGDNTDVHAFPAITEFPRPLHVAAVHTS